MRSGQLTAVDARYAGPPDLITALLGFSRLLIGLGVPVSSEQTRQALVAMTQVDILDPADVYFALRALLIMAPEHLPLFDAGFRRFWGWPASELAGSATAAAAAEAAVQAHGTQAGTRDTIPGGEPGSLSPVSGRRDVTAGGGVVRSLRSVVAPPPQPGMQLYSSTAAHGTETRARALGPGPGRKVARAVARVMRRLTLRPGRRFRPSRHGQRWDLRRTWRRSLSSGGTPVRILRKERKLKKPRVVLVCDVSRSMEPHSVFMLQVLHSFQRQRGRIESFVFSTALYRTTAYFRRWNLREAVARLTDHFPYWSGGTRIGQCLAHLERGYARYLLTRRTVVVVVSDGLDTGAQDLVRQAMQRLQRRSGAIIWLNPLVGTPGYQPRAKGMAVALPFVDLFLPVRDISTLDALAGILRSGRWKGAPGEYGRYRYLGTPIRGTGSGRARGVFGGPRAGSDPGTDHGRSRA